VRVACATDPQLLFVQAAANDVEEGLGGKGLLDEKLLGAVTALQVDVLADNPFEHLGQVRNHVVQNQRPKSFMRLSNKLLFRAGLRTKFCFADAEQPNQFSRSTGAERFRR
jgi:hypothetical protein